MYQFPYSNLQNYASVCLYFSFFLCLFFPTMETTMKYWQSVCMVTIFCMVTICGSQMQICFEDSIGSFDFLCSACPTRNESILSITTSPHVPERTRSNSTFASFENTTIWFLGTINCIIVALVFSKGKPFRQPTYTNCE